MKSSDLPQVFHLLKKQLSQYAFKFNFSQEEVGHYLIPQKDIVQTFVVENADKKIDSFVSYYNIPQQVLKDNPQGHKSFKSAYLFYYGASEQNSVTELIKLAIVKAGEDGFDVFNALDLMSNSRKVLLEDLKFSSGTGNLHHYFYNW